MRKLNFVLPALMLSFVMLVSGCGKKTTETKPTDNKQQTTQPTNQNQSQQNQNQNQSQQNQSDGTLTFDVTNNTGVTLVDVFVTPAETDHWGNDILPNNLFENGSTIRVTIPPTYGETCMFDMKITDTQGGHITFKNIDACKLISLKINSDATFEYLQTK